MQKTIITYIFCFVCSCWASAEEFTKFDAEYDGKISIYDFEKYNFNNNLLSESYERVLHLNGIHSTEQFLPVNNHNKVNQEYNPIFSLQESQSLKYKPLYKLANLSNKPLESHNLLFKTAATGSNNQESYYFQQSASCMIFDGYWFSEPVFLIDLSRPVIEEDSLNMYEKKTKDEYGDKFIQSKTGNWKLARH